MGEKPGWGREVTGPAQRHFSIAMHYESDSLYHVYNRGNNGQQLFFEPAHYHYFLRLFRQHVAPTVKPVAYCLMPNHFHFLLLTTAAGTQWDDSASSARQPMVRGLAKLLSTYSQALNQERGRQGALFQPKTKAKLLDGPFCEAGYPLLCFQYIHQNPLRAGLASSLADWPFSSYRDYAGLRSGTLCDQDVGRELLALPSEPVEFIAESTQMVDPVRLRVRLFLHPVGPPRAVGRGSAGRATSAPPGTSLARFGVVPSYLRAFNCARQFRPRGFIIVL
jgi:putative transposase